MRTSFWMDDNCVSTMDFSCMDTVVLDDDLTLWQFLHGWCSVFAIVLNEKFSYPMYCLTDEESMEFADCPLGSFEFPIIHVFCQQENLFIDSRGIVDNKHLFVDEFADFFDEPLYLQYSNEDIQLLRKELEIVLGSISEKVFRAVEDYVQKNIDAFTIHRGGEPYAV